MLTDPLTPVPFYLPADLPILRARFSLRLLADARLPAYKGGMFRGGFGYAFQRATCPQSCWGKSKMCGLGVICPYRWVFETPHPPEIHHLHDLQDIPRPFVIDLPDERRTQFSAGETLEFGLVMIGRGIDYLPYFIFGFARFAEAGLGVQRVPARLERVEVLERWQPVGRVIYQDGQVLANEATLPLLDGAAIAAHAAHLPADLLLMLRTPLRVKSQGALLTDIDLPALVRAVCWRLNALATFHGAGPWTLDYRSVVEATRAVLLKDVKVQWEEWARRSTRPSAEQTMQMGGLLGTALLCGVPVAVRTVLLAGSLVHVGKACVFGHGAYRLASIGLH